MCESGLGGIGCGGSQEKFPGGLRWHKATGQESRGHPGLCVEGNALVLPANHLGMFLYHFLDHCLGLGNLFRGKVVQ